MRAATGKGIPRGAVKIALVCLGFLLLIALFSEEAARAPAWLRGMVGRSPRLKLVLYPLAALILTAALYLMGNSLLTLFTQGKFSYD